MEEKLSSSLFLPGGGFFDNHVTVSGASEEAGIKVRSDQEFAWTGWSPSLMKYMENTKFCSWQALQVLITHFQL